ncbi:MULTISPECIES: nodulation efficiency, NfeD-like protein [Modicisalibacter]|uniref:nodulation efficiency, NfeD-like protein n=1 Tax=Modicisalibacter TaxID=574347 RepID=UPI00100A2F35|nr:MULTISPECIES: nodulation efficiency, NfeD-like protein [Halomonadaceae]MBZ9559598.1 nodulation efficiency, NfeD-like protein [Modicisalibacter sp. R2A 31.J]MBZ9577050.1 nodulation efficiency, NfeD-like protein [Modicisalibacter sp. MOD 31.J]
MDWNMAYVWLAVALLLGLAELLSGALVLLGLAVATLAAVLLAALGASLTWQLLGLGLAAGVMLPVVVKVIRPRFSPRGVAYGTTGTGTERGKVYHTLKRDFDGATGIEINGDFYRLRLADSDTTELPENRRVIFQRFDGTVAIVTLPHPTESSSS